MTLRKKKGQDYGDEQEDIVAFLRESTANEYPAVHFAHARCDACKGRSFRVQIDDAAGVCVRTCAVCGRTHPVGDSADFLDEAELDECECPCGKETFELTVGVALYEGSEDVRWIYIGLRCVACGLVGNYGDWKNEYDDYRELLARV